MSRPPQMECRSFVFFLYYLLFIIIFFFSSFLLLHQPENGLHRAAIWDWSLERGTAGQKVVGYKLWQGDIFFFVGLGSKLEGGYARESGWSSK